VKKVGLEEILSRVNSRLSPGTQDPRLVLTAVLEAIKEELASGHGVEFPGLPALEPGMPEGASADDRPAPSAKADAGEEDARPTTVVMFVPEVNRQVDLIAHRISAGGHAATAIDDQAALEVMLARRVPDLLLVDSATPGAVELVAAMKRERAWNQACVVMLCHDEHARDPESGLRIREDARLSAPYSLEKLVELLDAEIKRKRKESSWFSHDVHFQFYSETKAIEEANLLMITLLRQSGLEGNGEAAMSVAFREAVDNAVRHGNRSRGDRLVDVVYLLDREKVTVAVEDAGEGFDPAQFLKSNGPALSKVEGDNPAISVARGRLGKGSPGGLGIMLMLRCVDGLEYNEKGTRVRLIKYLEAQTADLSAEASAKAET